MLYTSLVINEKEYKLRLSAKSCVALEKRIGGNPLNMFMEVANGKLPTLESLLIMLHQSLTEYNHSITMEDVYSIYDEYCSIEGNNMMSLIQVLLQVMKDAGFIPEEDNEKNA